ncbi:KAP family P-loop NTPase fold protein [Rhodococcus sp. 2G]|uniref:KAP family P-loop NTPase fold protein n=1 Tax=Rhodococcus sp. 2G TaxID=1570939 RepID=UPI00090322F0|nr:P-loop NTPase fold protein [Rhodococcus sp. 2G]
MTAGPANTDSSITSFEQDKLERSEFSRRIADRIRLAGTGQSVVFGISGAWGAGKTSVLAMIRLALESDEKWAVVEFTPWAATDLGSLTGEFYEVIASAMPEKGKRGKTARAMLMSAAPVATSVMKTAAEGFFDQRFGTGTWQKIADTATSSTLDELGNYKPTPNPFRQQFAALSKAIERTGAKVLVIVDDLDRLHTDELLAVMKAVRLLGRFPGVHYLLSYDKRTMLDLIGASDLAGSDPDRARAYLEKIVQYPFELPPLQSAHSRREVTGQITAIAHRYGCDLTGTDTRSGRNWDLIDDLLALLPFIDNTTLRAIYRWCAQVDVLMALLGPGHLDLLDAALITYLRLHHEQIYDRLPTWRSKLVGDAPRAIVLSDSPRDTAEDWLTRLRNEAPGMSEPELTDVYKILVYLFPKLPHQLYSRTRPLSTTPQVHHDEFFDRYFMFTLPVGDISDVTAAKEVSSLLSDGSLPEGGVLRTFIAAGGGDQRLALRKLRRELGHAVTDAPPGCVLAALEHLWPCLLNEHGDLSLPGPGHDIAAMLIGQAVDASSDTDDARAAMNQARQCVGLRGITQILVEFRRGRDDYPAPIAAAVTDVRDEVLGVCMADLTSPQPPQEGQVLSFIYFLTTDMYTELRRRIDSAGLTQLDVAARMVAKDSNLREELQGFYHEPFEEIYPREHWDITQFPDPPSVDDLPDRQDYSIDARLAQAKFAMHSIMLGITGNQPD